MILTIIIRSLLVFIFLNYSKANFDYLNFPGDEKAANLRTRVIGGHACSSKDHPYILSIRYTTNNSHRCTATIISSIWVLTSANCGIRNYVTGTLTAFAGISSFSSQQYCSSNLQSSIVFRNYVHVNYSLTMPFDIALMELSKPILESVNVRYAKLAKYLDNMGRDLDETCKHGIVLGWGVRHNKTGRNKIASRVQHNKTGRNKIASRRISPYASILFCFDMPVIKNSYCAQLYGRQLENTRICTFDGRRRKCQGDSGGPLMCNGIQYGIVSSDTRCTHKRVPALYVRVDMFESFISKTIRQRSRSNSCHTYLNCIIYLLETILMFILK